MDNQLLSTLKKLRMSGLASTLEIRLHEAATTGLSHREFLELLLQDELLLRNDRLISRRVALAGFRDTKRLEDFDFSYNQSIKKSQVFDLATCRFIRERRDVLWVGPPGTGKSHLCQALGLSAIRFGMTVYYRSIFDTVRDFLHDEAMEGHDLILQRYLKPDLLIIDVRMCLVLATVEVSDCLIGPSSLSKHARKSDASSVACAVLQCNQEVLFSTIKVIEIRIHGPSNRLIGRCIRYFALNCSLVTGNRFLYRSTLITCLHDIAKHVPKFGFIRMELR